MVYMVCNGRKTELFSGKREQIMRKAFIFRLNFGGYKVVFLLDKEARQVWSIAL